MEVSKKLELAEVFQVDMCEGKKAKGRERGAENTSQSTELGMTTQ